MERTLVLLKPDCVQRRLMGRVIGRFEDKGLNIIAMKMLQVTPELAKQHYAEHVEKPFYPGLEAFITASPIVAMVVEGLEAIRVAQLPRQRPDGDGLLAAVRALQELGEEAAAKGEEPVALCAADAARVVQLHRGARLGHEEGREGRRVESLRVQLHA